VTHFSAGAENAAGLRTGHNEIRREYIDFSFLSVADCVGWFREWHLVCRNVSIIANGRGKFEGGK